ncbi:MAG: hypothetical protein ACYDCO_01790 [Armatimonadota bacterium]
MSGPIPNQTDQPIPLASSQPAAGFPPPAADLAPSQLPLPPENGPVQGQGQQQPLYAGKYTSPQEMERAYIELQQAYGRSEAEKGTLRDQYFMTQQQMAQLQAPPAQPPAPPVDPERERAQREYELLNPIAQQMIAAAGDDADENAIWSNLMAIYHAGGVAAEMRVQPVMQQLQAMQQTVYGNLGQQMVQQRVSEVFARNGYQTMQPQQFLQMVAPSINMDQFLTWSPQEQARVLEMAANDLEMRNTRNAQAGQALQSQYGMLPSGQPVPPQQPPFGFGQNGQYQQPGQPMYGQPAQGYMPGAPAPLPYQGQVNLYNQVPSQAIPNTMAPALPQGQPQQNAAYQEALAYYTNVMGIHDPARAAKAAQDYVQGQQRGAVRW